MPNRDGSRGGTKTVVASLRITPQEAQRLKRTFGSIPRGLRVALDRLEVKK